MLIPKWPLWPKWATKSMCSGRNPGGSNGKRCSDLCLKQFCLECIVSATLIILITHIIIAVLWMLIKILSVVINYHGEDKVIVVVGLGVL